MDKGCPVRVLLNSAGPVCGRVRLTTHLASQRLAQLFWAALSLLGVTTEHSVHPRSSVEKEFGRGADLNDSPQGECRS